MSQTQHKEAHRVLEIIRDAYKVHGNLNYRSVAQKLGRDPISNSRAVAQICDLLDAAAAYAGVPLLALIAVKNASDVINPLAWKKGVPPQIRQRIIDRSLAHKFRDNDFQAIENALIQLDGLGNRKAWEIVKQRSPSILEQLTTSTVIRRNDAIDDIGTDAPERNSYSGESYERDPRVRNTVLQIANGSCEYCGMTVFKKLDGSGYLETHHIIALANDGADRISNVIALCPNHHREAHYGINRDALEKEMIDIVGKRSRGNQQ